MSREHTAGSGKRRLEQRTREWKLKLETMTAKRSSLQPGAARDALDKRIRHTLANEPKAFMGKTAATAWDKSATFKPHGRGKHLKAQGV